MRRVLIAAATAGIGLLTAPTAALAHGIVGRADLPIPAWLFVWAAAVVLVVSFAALGALWRTPRFEDRSTRRILRIPACLEVVCGVTGVTVFALVIFAGFTGSQVPTANILPTFVYVLIWVALVPLCALFGDLFRPFNPWRAVARALGWLMRRTTVGESLAPLRYPAWLGYWPAVIGLMSFGWLELVSADGDVPRVLAASALSYAAIQCVGISLYGTDVWTARGDALSVYFAFFSRLSPFAVRDGHLVLRRFGAGLTQIELLPGVVAFACVAIGITMFDGASEGPLWSAVAGALQQVGVTLGMSLGAALEAAFTMGLISCVMLVAAIYRLGVLGLRSVTPGESVSRVSQRFVHSLVPIAFAYIVAHYFSLVVFQGQAAVHLASDPLGRGVDYFGTAAATIDYTVVSATGIWYVQVGSLVAGHVAALAVAHDRALAEFGARRVAARSQQWMLVVMVGFTCLGLWLLSAANG